MEIGGTDQLFNMLMGRELMRTNGAHPQVVGTLPLLVGLDGAQKMSKTLGNHIGITDPPFEMFSKVMSISDTLMLSWDRVLFPLPYYLPSDAFHKEPMTNMERKTLLAWRIVDRMYGTTPDGGRCSG